MMYHLRSLVLLILMLALVSWAPATALAATGDVTLDTPKTTVDGNERFVVSVKAEAPAGLYGVQLSLSYDDTLLNVLTVSAGSAWPVSDTFVARAAASGGGTANESIEFAATLNSAGSLSGNVELVTILIEAVNPPSTVTTDITNGTTLALIFSDAEGEPLTATAPSDLTITINRAPAVRGNVTLQSPGTGRSIAISGVGSSVLGQAIQATLSGDPFNVALPSGPGYTLTAVAACHLTAEKSGVTSPSSSHTVTLIAGDVNGDNRVNIQDLAAMGNRFGQGPGPIPCTDLNQDGTVNILDLSRAASNFGQQGPRSWP